MRRINFEVKFPGINLVLDFTSDKDGWVFYSIVCPKEYLSDDVNFRRALLAAVMLLDAGISFRVVQSLTSSGQLLTQIIMEWERSAYQDFVSQVMLPSAQITEAGPDTIVGTGWFIEEG